MRVIHASPDAGEIDLAVTGGDTLFENVGFGDATDYRDLAPGTYGLDLVGDEDRVLATAPEVTIADARVYDLVAFGQVDDQTLGLLPLETSVSPSCVEVLGLEAGLEDTCVRVIHAAPDAPAIDVYVGDSVIVQGLAFGSATEYVNLPSGDGRPVQVVAVGASVDEAVIDTTLDFDAGQAYEILPTGEGDELELTMTGIDLRPLPENQARLRVVHASPDAGNVDVAVSDGPLLFGDVEFREATDYAVVDAGTYTIDVRPAGEDTVALRTDLEPGSGHDLRRDRDRPGRRPQPDPAGADLAGGGARGRGGDLRRGHGDDARDGRDRRAGGHRRGGGDGRGDRDAIASEASAVRPGRIWQPGTPSAWPTRTRR